MEAERYGAAAHGQRPLPGQSDPNRAPGHHAVPPAGGQPVLGTTSDHLNHGERGGGRSRGGGGNILDRGCRRTQGITSARCLSACWRIKGVKLRTGLLWCQLQAPARRVSVTGAPLQTFYGLAEPSSLVYTIHLLRILQFFYVTCAFLWKLFLISFF